MKPEDSLHWAESELKKITPRNDVMSKARSR